MQVLNWFKSLPGNFYSLLKEHIGKISAHTLGWITILLLHFAAVPTLLAVLVGTTDKMPSVDIVLFIWSALITLFFKAMIEKNFLYVATVCVGFAAQTIIMSLILFR